MGTSITLSHVFDALGIMLLLTLVAVSIVSLVIYGLYLAFRNDSNEKQQYHDLLEPKKETSKNRQE